MKKQDIIREYEDVVEGYITEMSSLDTDIVENQARLEELNSKMRLELDMKLSFIEMYDRAKVKKEIEAGEEI